MTKYQLHSSSEEASFSLADSAPELPFALPLPPSESPFAKFVYKKVMIVRDIAAVFPTHVGERSQFTFFVVVDPKLLTHSE